MTCAVVKQPHVTGWSDQSSTALRKIGQSSSSTYRLSLVSLVGNCGDSASLSPSLCNFRPPTGQVHGWIRATADSLRFLRLVVACIMTLD